MSAYVFSDQPLHRSIKLPVAALLKQYKENLNPLIRHFDLLYIQQGVDRLPVSVSSLVR